MRCGAIPDYAPVVALTMGIGDVVRCVDPIFGLTPDGLYRVGAVMQWLGLLNLIVEPLGEKSEWPTGPVGHWCFQLVAQGAKARIYVTFS
jgi:hypothetical protein